MTSYAQAVSGLLRADGVSVVCIQSDDDQRSLAPTANVRLRSLIQRSPDKIWCS